MLPVCNRLINYCFFSKDVHQNSFHINNVQIQYSANYHQPRKGLPLHLPSSINLSTQNIRRFLFYDINTNHYSCLHIMIVFMDTYLYLLYRFRKLPGAGENNLVDQLRTVDHQRNESSHHIKFFKTWSSTLLHIWTEPKQLAG